MKKELIKQIEKMPGVKTVESMSDKVVVTFEAEKVVVECTNEEQRLFIEQQRGFKRESTLKYMALSKSARGHSSDADSVLTFTQYLKDYNLRTEYLKFMVKEAEELGLVDGVKYLSPNIKIERVVEFPLYLSSKVCRICCKNGEVLYDGKWAEIIIDEIELVKGEIYYHDTETQPNIFRLKSVTKNGSFMTYSTVFIGGCIFINDSSVLKGRNPKPATDKQKRKLIKSEIKNGYFHELQ